MPNKVDDDYYPEAVHNWELPPARQQALRP